MDTTSCPQCGAAATVDRRPVLESTEGPVEHVRVDCAEGHWFVLPVAWLERARRAAAATGAGRA
jgi:hypothetical protein